MKKTVNLILLVLITLFSTINVYASTNTYDRNTMENYGVNKDVKDIDSKLQYIMKTKKVDASEKIYDFADILTDEEEKLLKEKIDTFIEENNMDMVIVTDTFAYSYDKQNEEYADDFYDYNDFGMNFEYNSGVLLLRNTYEQDPYFNIYSFGNAQLYYNYNRIEEVLDHIYDDIHEGNYKDGFSAYIKEMKLMYEFGIPKEMHKYKVDDKGYLYIPYTIPWKLSITIATIVTLIVMTILIKKNKMVAKARLAEEYLNKDTIKITNRKDTFIRSHTSSHTRTRDTDGYSGGGGGFGGGFSSSGGSSGGGHTSGGGRHG